MIFDVRVLLKTLFYFTHFLLSRLNLPIRQGLSRSRGIPS